MMDYDIIDTNFCAISGSSQWQHWLSQYDPEIYRSFAEKMLAAIGCQGSRKVMLEVYADLCKKRATGKNDVIEFLKKNFPQAVQNVNDSMLQLFENNSFTIPKRAKILASELTEFCKKHPYVEHAVVGEYAIVEYLTESMAGVIKNVPDRNWVIRKLVNSGIIQASKIL